MDWLDWLLLIIRVAVVFFALLISVLLYVWMERKVIADFQTRKGPMRAGPRGILITLADGIKLFFKEGITPTLADRPVYLIAPVVAMLPAFLAFAVIPFGASVTLFGREVPFQIADLSIGILWILAMTSLMIYAIVLAGWSSGSNYPLLGSVRSSAQMISYEVSLGLSVVGVFMATQSLRLTDVVNHQADGTWNCFAQPIGFLVFVVCAFAETNRLPFDLPEAETELVAGYHTEYSSMKFAMFFLAEYTSMFVFSSLVAVLFLGGWDLPFVSQAALAPLGNWAALIGFGAFMLKALAFMFFYVWVRWTIPRFRYDQVMTLGWKVLLPLTLVNIVITGAWQLLAKAGGR